MFVSKQFNGDRRVALLFLAVLQMTNSGGKSFAIKLKVDASIKMFQFAFFSCLIILRLLILLLLFLTFFSLINFYPVIIILSFRDFSCIASNFFSFIISTKKKFFKKS